MYLQPGQYVSLEDDAQMHRDSLSDVEAQSDRHSRAPLRADINMPHILAKCERCRARNEYDRSRYRDFPTLFRDDGESERLALLVTAGCRFMLLSPSARPGREARLA